MVTQKKEDVSSAVTLKLILNGPARLEYGARELKLRRKGLAILYYLAIEGLSRRGELADLLWGTEDASGNLRVELHRLREALAKVGYIVFPAGEELLKLPPLIQLDTAQGLGEVMEGLEDLSAEFQIWLDGQRARWMTERSGLPDRQDLVAELSRHIRPPYLLFLHGLLGSACDEFARSLARALGLPYLEGLHGNIRAFHYLAPPYPTDAVNRILHDRDSVWAIECPPAGEDSRLDLELRSRWPSERMHDVRLPPLTWFEVRQGLLAHLSFRHAAKIFLFTLGNPMYTREVLMHEQPQRLVSDEYETSLPPRIRATVQLEGRFLSLEARTALESLSVHPGFLTNGLLDAFGATRHLDELERRGHLLFKGRWRFTEESSRRVFYTALQRGRLQRYHNLAADCLMIEGDAFGEAYHRLRAGNPDAANNLLSRCDLTSWVQLFLQAQLGTEPATPMPKAAPMGVGTELALLESGRLGPGLESHDGIDAMVRTPLQGESSMIDWLLPSEPCLVRLQGRAVTDNPFAVGISGSAVPLQVRFLGGMSETVIFGPVQQAHKLATGELVLPLAADFDYYFHHSGAHSLQIFSAAECGLIEFQCSAFRIQEGQKVVNVWELAARS